MPFDNKPLHESTMIQVAANSQPISRSCGRSVAYQLWRNLTNCTILCLLAMGCFFSHTMDAWFKHIRNYLSISLIYCSDVIMSAIASQITSLTIVYSTVPAGAHQKKHQSSASLAFVRGIHRWPMNSPHKWPVTRKMFRFNDVIMW